MVHKTLKSIKDGLYHIKGKTYKYLSGSRAMVYHQTAYKTKSGLTLKDMKKNSRGKIVSKRKSTQATRDNRLWKMGYRYEKKKFGVVKVDV